MRCLNHHNIAFALAYVENVEK